MVNNYIPIRDINHVFHELIPKSLQDFGINKIKISPQNQNIYRYFKNYQTRNYKKLNLCVQFFTKDTL